MAFLQYLAMFYSPLTAIAESTTWFANFFSVSRRICDLLDTPGESGAPRSLRLPRPIHGQVELKEVSFGYEKSRPVLRDISLRIAAGRDDRRGGAERLRQIDLGQPYRPLVRCG